MSDDMALIAGMLTEVGSATVGAGVPVAGALAGVLAIGEALAAAGAAAVAGVEGLLATAIPTTAIAVTDTPPARMARQFTTPPWGSRWSA
jgi:hypothetical protein